MNKSTHFANTLLNSKKHKAMAQESNKEKQTSNVK